MMIMQTPPIPPQMSTEYDAIWGFIGVLVGAASSMWATYWATTRQEKKAHEREDNERAYQFHRARRLVAAEFFLAETVLEASLDQGGWGAGAAPAFALTAWETYGGLLAGELTDEAWDLVHATVTVFRVAGQAAAVTPDEDFDAADIESLTDMLPTIRLARAALGGLTLEERETDWKRALGERPDKRPD